MDFFYDASGYPFAVKYNGDLCYYITNLQGDVMSIVDEQGNVVASYQYDPYGNVISATGDLAEINPLRYRGYYYDTETKLYYLQSRYYDPELGRFINADALVSTGQGVLGNNMYAYCLNNPVRYRDASGVAPEEATNTEEDDDKEPGTRVVGGGVQFDADVGLATFGGEIIIYWDSTVCGEGNWKVVVYSYNGMCVSADDSIVQSAIMFLMSNSEAFNISNENEAALIIELLCAFLEDSYSIGVSGVVIIGNNDFRSTLDYMEAFTSVNYSWGWFRGSYAYSESCRAISIGANVAGRSLIPSRTISQTYYYREYEYTFAAPF